MNEVLEEVLVDNGVTEDDVISIGPAGNTCYLNGCRWCEWVMFVRGGSKNAEV